LSRSTPWCFGFRGCQSQIQFFLAIIWSKSIIVPLMLGWWTCKLFLGHKIGHTLIIIMAGNRVPWRLAGHFTALDFGNMHANSINFFFPPRYN
jgi:hypothetical protein